MLKNLIISLMFICIIPHIALAKYGLVSNNNEPLDLLTLQTNALVEGPYAHIEYIQTYHNSYSRPLETRFYFPRTESSIFYHFEATFQNKTIIGYISEKEAAKREYQRNVQRGNTVAYAERNAQTPDVMEIKVGNIPAGESVEIKFSVIQPLDVIVNKFWGFTLPSVLTERYTPASVNAAKVPEIRTVGAQSSEYKDWKVSVEIMSNSQFTYISNPSHHLKAEMSQVVVGTNSSIYKASWNVTIVPNKDFIVYFRPQTLEVPATILATHPTYPNDHVLLFNFIPEFNSLQHDLAVQHLENGEEGMLELKRLELDDDIQKAKAEFIFVIDRSGSMSGRRIENLKNALVKFFQTLPKDSLFNIISFGSSYQLYRSNSVRYTSESLKEVISWIWSIDANMGGTEILGAFREASSLPTQEGYPRTIIMMTDGDVSNPHDVVQHALQYSQKMRFCAVGIGYGASDFLVKNVAKAGNCESVFVQENEDIGDKAMFLIKAAISQHLSNIKLSLECFGSNGKKIYSEDERVGMILKNQVFKKWVYLRDIPDIRTCKAKLEYYHSMKEGYVSQEVTGDFLFAEYTSLWHKVAYNEKMKELDLQLKSKEQYNSQGVLRLKQEIIALSTKYQILSDYTAFLAVIKELAETEKIEGSVKVNIPNLKSVDYTTDAYNGSGNIQEIDKDNGSDDDNGHVGSSDGDNGCDGDNGVDGYDYDADIMVDASVDVDVMVDVDVDIEVDLMVNTITACDCDGDCEPEEGEKTPDEEDEAAEEEQEEQEQMLAESNCMSSHPSIDHHQNLTSNSDVLISSHGKMSSRGSENQESLEMIDSNGKNALQGYSLMLICVIIVIIGLIVFGAGRFARKRKQGNPELQEKLTQSAPVSDPTKSKE